MLCPEEELPANCSLMLLILNTETLVEVYEIRVLFPFASSMRISLPL